MKSIFNDWVIRTLLIGFVSVLGISQAYSQGLDPELLSQIGTRKTVKKINKMSSLYAGTEFAANNQARTNAEAPKYQDTARKENRIDRLYFDGEYFKLKLKIAEDEAQLRIAVFNMLGKKILDVFSGEHKEGRIYDIDPQYLPNGMYFCIVQGSNFRLAEKFSVSK